ncbi:hypothetical protein ACWXVT_00140 [Mycoplasma sp. 1573]
MNDVQKPSEQQQTRKRIQIITPNNFDKIEYHKLSLLKGKFKCRFIYKDDSKLFINFLNEKGMTEFSVLWDSDILKKSDEWHQMIEWGTRKEIYFENRCRIMLEWFYQVTKSKLQRQWRLLQQNAISSTNH